MTLLLSWNPDDRPRERLAACGPDALADGELLAILLGAGRPGENVVELAHALPARAGGPPRAAVVSAALALGRRAVGARPKRGRRLGAASDVWAHYRARLAVAAVEEFWVLALDVRHRLQFELCAARGSLTGVEVHPRDVFRPLIRGAAAAVIFCHNHPSGDPTPSRQDLELTTRLRDVGDLCGITVLDHVVVAADGFTSLADRGWG